MGKLKIWVSAYALALAFSVSIAVGQSTIGIDGPTPTKSRIVFLGDSLTAGLGVGPDHAFPGLIAEKIRTRNLPFEVVNAGVSGDTSADGLHRLDWLLQQRIDILMIVLGANDGLRGLSPELLKQNLQTIIEKAKTKNPRTQIIIAGMRMPPNLGQEYAAEFEAVYPAIARKNNAVLIPFLLEGVGGHSELNQQDQIHPTAEGHKIIAESVWRALAPMLHKS